MPSIESIQNHIFEDHGQQDIKSPDIICLRTLDDCVSIHHAVTERSTESQHSNELGKLRTVLILENLGGYSGDTSKISDVIVEEKSFEKCDNSSDAYQSDQNSMMNESSVEEHFSVEYEEGQNSSNDTLAHTSHQNASSFDHAASPINPSFHSASSKESSTLRSAENSRHRHHLEEQKIYHQQKEYWGSYMEKEHSAWMKKMKQIESDRLNELEQVGRRSKSYRWKISTLLFHLVKMTSCFYS